MHTDKDKAHFVLICCFFVDQTVIRHPPSITPSSIAVNHLHHLRHHRHHRPPCHHRHHIPRHHRFNDHLLSTAIGETILNITVLLQPSPSSIEIITTGPQIAFFLLSLWIAISVSFLSSILTSR